MNVVRMSRGCWVAGSLWSTSVWAAPEPSSPPPAPVTAPESSPAPPSPAPSSADPSNEELEARDAAADAAFKRGHELAVSGELVPALAEFERAYDLVPAYEVLYNIGTVCYGLKRWARARRAYEQYLQLGGPQIPQHRFQQVNELIAQLSTKTAKLRLMLNVTGEDVNVHVDGEPVEANEVTGVILEPGDHLVRVSKPGFAPLEQVLRTSDGDSMNVLLPLAPLHSANLPPDSPIGATARPRVETVSAEDTRTPLWVPWTVTGVLAASWITTAGLAIKARHDRDIIEQPSTSPDRIDDARQLHKTLAIVSDILLASTLVSAGVSAYVTWWPSTPPTAHNTSRSQLPMDGLAVGISGNF